MTKENAPQTPWYHSGVVIALGLLLCAPLGLGLLWDSKASHLGTKIVGTLVFGGMWAFGAFVYLASTSDRAAPNPTLVDAPVAFHVPEQSPPAEPVRDGSFGPGTMVVGKDIQPGSYRSAGATPGSPLCYAERLSGFSGEPHEIISNDVAQPGASVVVTIKPTDVGFKSQGCERWERLE